MITMTLNLLANLSIPPTAIATVIVGIVTIGLSLHWIVCDYRAKKPQSRLAFLLCGLGGVVTAIGGLWVIWSYLTNW